MMVLLGKLGCGVAASERERLITVFENCIHCEAAGAIATVPPLHLVIGPLTEHMAAELGASVFAMHHLVGKLLISTLARITTKFHIQESMFLEGDDLVAFTPAKTLSWEQARVLTSAPHMTLVYA